MVYGGDIAKLEMKRAGRTNPFVERPFSSEGGLSPVFSHLRSFSCRAQESADAIAFAFRLNLPTCCVLQ